MYRTKIMLHVKCVLLKQLIPIFNPSLYHRLINKKACQDYTHKFIMLSIEQNLSSLRFSFETFDRPLKYRSFASYFDLVS